MMGDWVRSKPGIGIMGNISALMATLSAFGLAMYLGVPFIGINLAAPFLMIGKSIEGKKQTNYTYNARISTKKNLTNRYYKSNF